MPGIPSYRHMKPKPEPVSLETIYEAGQQLGELKVKMLYYLLYLTGGRIREVLSVRKDDVKKVNQNGFDFLIVKIRTEKNPSQYYRTLPVILDDAIEGGMGKEILAYIEPLRQEDLLFPGITRTNAWNKLNKIHFTSTAWKWESLDDNKRRRMELPNYKFGLHPHYLRRCRLTHMTSNYMVSAQTLKQFAGWSTLSEADTYIMLNWQDLAKAMSYAKGGVK